MTAGSLHSTSLALHPPSHHTACSLWNTSSTAWALHPHSWKVPSALQPQQGHCIQLKWHCRHTEITTGSLNPTTWALHPPSQHTG
ncbi:hypothetical protein AWN79_19715 [Clostridioides difficile]|nr:hypothetical protein AWN79_19715 [Clostridioides difficile]